MADRKRQSIRCIVRTRQLCQMKDALCHLHHLLFLGVSVADDRHLDLIRRIGNRMQTLLRQCEQNNAACLRDLYTGRYILLK